jgi:hypothetical protein
MDSPLVASITRLIEWLQPAVDAGDEEASVQQVVLFARRLVFLTQAAGPDMRREALLSLGADLKSPVYSRHGLGADALGRALADVTLLWIRMETAVAKLEGWRQEGLVEARPPAASDAVVAAEQRLGHGLPFDYCAFLGHFNGLFVSERPIAGADARQGLMVCGTPEHLHDEQMDARRSERLDAFLAAALEAGLMPSQAVLVAWTSDDEVIAIVEKLGGLSVVCARHDLPFGQWPVLAESFIEFIEEFVTPTAKHEAPSVCGPVAPPSAELAVALHALARTVQDRPGSTLARTGASSSDLAELERHAGGAIAPELAAFLRRYNGVILANEVCACPSELERPPLFSAADRLLGCREILGEEWRLRDQIEPELCARGIRGVDCLPVAWTKSGQILVLAKAEDGDSSILAVHLGLSSSQWPIHYGSLAEMIAAFASAPGGVALPSSMGVDFPFAAEAATAEADASSAVADSLAEVHEEPLLDPRDCLLALHEVWVPVRDHVPGFPRFVMNGEAPFTWLFDDDGNLPVFAGELSWRRFDETRQGGRVLRVEPLRLLRNVNGQFPVVLDPEQDRLFIPAAWARLLA